MGARLRWPLNMLTVHTSVCGRLLVSGQNAHWALQLVAQILRQYQERGDAMRYLDNQGKIAWKASPRFLTKLADAERDAQDELEDSW
jgi:hypothetical protein